MWLKCPGFMAGADKPAGETRTPKILDRKSVSHLFGHPNKCETIGSYI